MAKDRLVGSLLQDTFRVDREIGHGGMGTVYEISHLRLHRRFALKLLSPTVADHPEAIARFKREAKVTSAVGHPHILEVIDFNYTEEGVPYIIMELLDGVPLSDLLRRVNAFSLENVATIFRQASAALHAAHRRGVVHRDLKPQNIFLCKRGSRDDFVKVVDFGISKILDSGTSLTKTQALMGTPAYMSPEQADERAAELDLRTDIYSMGIIIYEMLAGQAPFSGRSVPAVLYKVVHHELPLLRAKRPDVSEAIEDVIRKATNKEPSQRFASMDEFWCAFRDALDEDVQFSEPTEDRRETWAEGAAPAEAEAPTLAAPALREDSLLPIATEEESLTDSLIELSLADSDVRELSLGDPSVDELSRVDWSSADSPLGKQVGNYIVLDLLGRGRMGAVYLAEHPKIGRQVAIKFLASHVSGKAGIGERFAAEARAMARINHPNVVAIYDFGQMKNGRLYYIMELLEGRDLSKVMDDEVPIDPRLVMRYLEPIARGLQAGHDKAVAHLNLKPENIFVLDRKPLTAKILDFGIAKLLGSTDSIGSPLTVAPEQAAGRSSSIGPQADIYSLGVILYWMLAGRPPFTGAAAGVLSSHIESPPPSLQQRVPSVPSLVAQAVHRCLEKSPADRPASAKEVLAVFSIALRTSAGLMQAPGSSARGAGASATQMTTLQGTGKRSPSPLDRPRRLPVKWLSIGAGGLAAVVVALVLWLGGSDEPQTAAPPPPVVAAKPPPGPVHEETHVVLVAARDPKVLCRARIGDQTHRQRVPCRFGVSGTQRIQLELTRHGYHSVSRELNVEKDRTFAVRLSRRTKRLTIVETEVGPREPAGDDPSSRSQPSQKPAGDDPSSRSQPSQKPAAAEKPPVKKPRDKATARRGSGSKPAGKRPPAKRRPRRKVQPSRLGDKIVGPGF